MYKTERSIRRAFEKLQSKTPPRMLTDLQYGVIHRDDKPDLVDFSTLVGYIDIAAQFQINHIHEGERALKVRIVDSLYSAIHLLEDCIESLE